MRREKKCNDFPPLVCYALNLTQFKGNDGRVNLVTVSLERRRELKEVCHSREAGHVAGGNFGFTLLLSTQANLCYFSMPQLSNQ